MKRMENYWVKVILVGIILIAAYKLFDNIKDIAYAFGYFIDIIMPCIYGAVIAFFLYRPSKRVEKLVLKINNKFIKRKSNAISVFFLYIIIFAFLGLIIKFLVPSIFGNLEELVANIPDYIKKIDHFVSGNSFLSRFDVVETLNQKAADFISKNLSTQQLNKYIGVISNIADSFVTFFLSVVLSIYMLLEKEDIFKILNKIKGLIIKDEKANIFGRYVGEIINIFYSYFAGLALDAVLIGTISAIALSLFNVPYAVLLGLLVAVGNMIPFFGPIVSAAMIYIISAIAFGPIKAIWVILFQLALGQVDGNLIQPKIISNSTGISPLLVLVSVIVFGGLFGVVGMIIGVPISATIKMVLTDYFDNRKLDGSKIKE
ncbi:MAG: AI-2E family transporter [Bacillota bacterium]|nr:AI-2E family transporter [Bacillota bacterium]